MTSPSNSGSDYIKKLKCGLKYTALDFRKKAHDFFFFLYLDIIYSVTTLFVSNYAWYDICVVYQAEARGQ